MRDFNILQRVLKPEDQIVEDIGTTWPLRQFLPANGYEAW